MTSVVIHFSKYSKNNQNLPRGKIENKTGFSTEHLNSERKGQLNSVRKKRFCMNIDSVFNTTNSSEKYSKDRFN